MGIWRISSDDKPSSLKDFRCTKVSTALLRGDISQQQLGFCIAVYDCMNRSFDGNGCGYLHSEPALLDFSQNASRAFKTCACISESILSLHWAWGETCDHEAAEEGRVPSAPDWQGLLLPDCWVPAPSSTQDHQHQPRAANKAGIGSPKSVPCDPDQRNKIKSIPSTKALNPGSTAFPKCGPGEALHQLSCGWEANMLW